MNEFLLGHKEVENKVFDVVHIERIPVEFLNVFTHLINVMKLLKVFFLYLVVHFLKAYWILTFIEMHMNLLKELA